MFINAVLDPVPLASALYVFFHALPDDIVERVLHPYVSKSPPNVAEGPPTQQWILAFPLYHALMLECADLVVHGANSLPHFEPLQTAAATC